MKLQLPDGVSSLQDVQALILDVRAYARWYEHVSVKKKLRVRGKTEQPDISAAAEELIHDWAIKKPLTTASLDELLGALEAYKSSSPSLTIVLAAPPTAGIKKNLVGWLRKNVAPDILINFESNSGLLGGMVLRSGSRIFDWSFRRQILENASKFPEVLRNVR